MLLILCDPAPNPVGFRDACVPYFYHRFEGYHHGQNTPVVLFIAVRTDTKSLSNIIQPFMEVKTQWNNSVFDGNVPTTTENLLCVC